MRRFLSLCAASAALWAPVSAQTVAEGSRLHADGTVSLPAIQAAAPAQQHALARQGQWQAFSQQHGGWSAVFNAFTGTPVRAFGPAVKAPGFDRVTAANVEDAAWAFVRAQEAVLGTREAELRLRGAVEANGRFYVSFVQQHDGVDVLESDVELRIFPNGNVAAFGSTIYPDIDVDVVPSLPEETAVSAATVGTGFVAGRSEAEARRLVIFPVRHQTASKNGFVRYHLVYEVDVIADPVTGVYTAWVDAHTGDIVRRDLDVFTTSPEGHAHTSHAAGVHAPSAASPAALPSPAAAVVGTISGLVKPPNNPFAESEPQNFPNTNVTVDGVEYTTDDAGAFSTGGIPSGPVSYAAGLVGPWAYAVNLSGDDALITGETDGSAPLDIVWDDSNSTVGERSMFYHVNILRDFIFELDPGFVGLARPVRAQVNDTSDVCNAYWNSNFLMNFYAGGGGCPNMALLGTVVYHEYGHGVNQTLYDQADDGVINGSARMFNRAVNEGMADVQSHMFIDDPLIGVGFQGANDPYLRNGENTFVYPDHYSGDLNPVTGGTYQDGEILAGAFWQYRKLTDLERFRQVAHFSRYGRPDDTQLTTNAYAEFFVEALIADDDDGDLSNGTPNSDALFQAFDMKGIGTQLFVQASFAHAPFGDTSITDRDYPITFQVQLIGESEANLVYSTDGFQSTETVAAELVEGTTYTALMPRQPAGTVVDYYIEVTVGDVTYTFPDDAEAEAHRFLVGFERAFLDEFEVDNGWTVTNIDVTKGAWERGDPEPTGIGDTPIQPDNDYSFTGTQAWITGLEAGGGITSNSLSGTTVLTSPVFDLTDYRRAFVRFYLWHAARGNGAENFVAEISDDGGATWVEAVTNRETTLGWEMRQFNVADFVQRTSQVQVRFTAQEIPPGVTVVEVGIDDFELLDAPDAVVSSETGTPTAFAFNGAYPNPAAQRAALAFALPQPADVQATVYDVLGRAVATAEAAFAEGAHTLDVDVSRLAAGAYVVRLTAGAHTATHKITVVR